MPSVGLADIEPVNSEDAVKNYRYNERSSTFKNMRSDFELCGIIDRCILPEFRVQSIYQLKTEKRESIRRILTTEFHVSEQQANRCLWL